MKKFLIKFIVLAIIMVAVIDIGHDASAAVVYSNRSTWSTNDGPCLSANGPSLAGHRFKTNDATHILNSVTIQLRAVRATSTVYLHLYNDDGVLWGSQIASLGSFTTVISGTYPIATFVPPYTVRLEPLTTYWIVASTSDTGSCDVEWVDYEDGSAPSGAFTFLADGAEYPGGWYITITDFLSIEMDTTPFADLSVTASCFASNPENLSITILAGDSPFNITASAGVNLPLFVYGHTTVFIDGPEKWDNVTVTETKGDFQSINLGQFKCYPSGRPTQVGPPHRARTTSPYPVFSWLSFPEATNYRVWLFDNSEPSQRTIDIRENSGGALSMTLSQPLSPGRYFWRMRARVNRIWSRWSTRWAIFVDPAFAPAQLPAIQVNDSVTAPTTAPVISQPTIAAPESVPTSTPLPPPNAH